eukprot:g4768.t1
MSFSRLSKAIARSGICSRRAADSLIQAGRVKVNGAIVDTPATNVLIKKDKIHVDDKLIPACGPTKVWAMHKLKGELVTRSGSDLAGRPTLDDRLRKMGLPFVIPIGRLDYHTEGLILHTNDGDLARFLELPQNKVPRRYLVLVKGVVQKSWLRSLMRKGGSTFGGIRYRPIDARILRMDGPKQTWLDVRLTEGKNREIRRVMKAMKLDVRQLIRIEYGPYKLGELPPGAVMNVPLKFRMDKNGNRVEK